MSILYSLPLLAISIKGIGIATVTVSVVGALIGVFLGIAAKKLEVPVDEREAEVRSLLPGNNCGGCGYPGCDGLAAAIASGTAKATDCPVANGETHAKIAAVMGASVETREKQVAYVKCDGTCEKTTIKSNYFGIEDCKKAAATPGSGPKQCGYGCMGYGSCVKACKFDAIHVVNGIAYVDKEKCTSCGLCIPECPNSLIEFVPYNTHTFVRCSSNDKGKEVKAACSVGCIGCMLCVKACEYDAIHVTNNLAKIDYAKCTNCGKCVQKCPTNAIFSELEIVEGA